ncbi:MAG: beta-lactamase family protein [bacterium]|nr:beta-lactamase family protein [bacterium]
MSFSRIISLLILTPTIISFICCSGDSNPVDPETDPPIEIELTFNQKLQAELDTSLGKCPNGRGATLAVLMPDNDIWIGNSGYSGPTPADSMESDMLFEIGDSRNIYTTAMILKYNEEGLLSLDDPVSNWITGYQHIDSTITVRQLLDHSSGLFDYSNHYMYPMRYFFYVRTRVWTPESVLSLFLDEPFADPGSYKRFSRTNYLLLQMIIDEISNSDRVSQFRDRMFEPFDLSDTYIDYFEDVPEERIAHGWNWDEYNVYYDISVESRIAWSTFHSMSILTSAEDFLTWFNSLLEGRIINRNSLDEMLAFNDVAGDSDKLGMGIEQVSYNGLEIWCSESEVYGYQTWVSYIPSLDVYISLMCNFNGQGIEIIMPDIADIIIDELSTNQK